MTPLVLFALALCIFHGSEFALTFYYNREHISRRSWLLSWPYCIAMGASLVEYGLERTLMPSLKTGTLTTRLGLLMIVAGEALRKTGMVTATHNFTHAIASQRTERHRLVTHGVYGYMRHPGYAGWALWAIGTQVLLANPVCTPAFLVVVWRFFRSRVEYEDALLLSFFGQQFHEYKASVPSGILGIP
ncbi:hypothetical protein ACKKBG_A04045 [Auxenochlorella protothecoides x Auxenochlorella symbiontica]